METTENNKLKTLTIKKMKELKTKLLNGEIIEFKNCEDIAFIWFNNKTQNFCLEFNCKVIKSTKTFQPIIKLINKKRLIES